MVKRPFKQLNNLNQFNNNKIEINKVNNMSFDNSNQLIIHHSKFDE